MKLQKIIQETILQRIRLQDIAYSEVVYSGGALSELRMYRNQINL